MQLDPENDGPKIYAPADVDGCVRTTLRFPVTSVVEAFLGEEHGWAVGVVVRHYHREPSWEPGRWAPYQIKVSEGPHGFGGEHIFAPVDTDACVRPPPVWPWPGGIKADE